MARRGAGLLTHILRPGIELLGRTVRLEVDNPEALAPDRMIGYWHGDSCGAMLLLRLLRRRGVEAATAVTADSRGDVIEGVMARYGLRAVRVRDGLAARRALPELAAAAADRERLFALALDGPTGPLHTPKRLLFQLACRTGRGVVQLRFHYSAALRLRRWDHYALPLPFSRVTVEVRPLGNITKQLLREFPEVAARLAGSEYGGEAAEYFKLEENMI